MRAMLPRRRVEPVVRPPIRGTSRARLSNLQETAQAKARHLRRHSTEEVARSGFALKHHKRLTPSERLEAWIIALTKRSVSNARYHPPAHNCMSAKFSMTFSLTRGRVDAVVRRGPQLQVIHRNRSFLIFHTPPLFVSEYPRASAQPKPHSFWT